MIVLFLKNVFRRINEWVHKRPASYMSQSWIYEMRYTEGKKHTWLAR